MDHKHRPRLFAAALVFTLFALALEAKALPVAIEGPNVESLAKTRVGAENKKALVVVFLSASCPCSDSHMAELKALRSDFPDFAFVGVHSNTDEGKAPTQDYFNKAHLPFPVIQDTGAKLADQFKALKTPHAFVVGPDGKTLYNGGVTDSHELSSADRKYLREALSDLQKGQKVKTPMGRTLGCSISRGGTDVW